MAEGDVHRLVQQRLEKVEALRAQGINPYANDFNPEMTCAQFTATYEKGNAEALAEIETRHTLAGRLMASRQMGKVTFLRIRDRSGDLQVFVQKNRVGDRTYDQVKKLDLGDFVGVAGTPKRTKTGELSIAADGVRILTKAIHPLPDKFHGLQDIEARYRQRYIDLAMNPEVRETFKVRSQIVRGIQRFLDDRGFLEVETPMLGDVAGGAAARPFKTHHNALDADFQMRIATELHLKRLVVGGFERVYEIGRLFRNEGISTKHNPEFTTIEFYQAYATYQDLMDLTEELLSTLVESIHGTTVLPYGEHQISFARPFRRAPIAQLVGEHLKIDRDLRNIDSVEEALAICAGNCVTDDAPLHVVLKELSDDEANAHIPGFADAGEGMPLVKRAEAAKKACGAEFYAQLGRALDDAWASKLPIDEEDDGDLDDTGKFTVTAILQDEFRVRRRRLALALLYEVFDHAVEGTLINPTFITDFSVSVSPLARRRDTDHAVVDRFEMIVAGMELANAFSELNDPVDQKQRFLDQLRERDRGDVEAHGYDEDYVHALEIGMPPTAGEGIGIDRLVMLLTNSQSIRDVILFPQMRPEKKDT